MKLLAIETSCDDTSIAVLEEKNSRFSVLSNIVSSQIEVHKKWGGVYPTLAKREHQKNIVPVLTKALNQAKELKNCDKSSTIKFLKIEKILEREPELFKKLEKFLKKYEKPDIDFIAVTEGPGLDPCLWIGINFAKALSYFWNIPIIPVNHIESHILVNFLNKDISLPAICLVVSGGHTQLILMEKIGKYEIIGETRDDAAGECFDKTAKILGLSYPGGPEIAKIAKNLKVKPKMPRPMINTDDFDFSFSGLKTAVLYDSKNNKKEKKYIMEMCSDIQQAIIDVLIRKTSKAVDKFNAKSVILGGGVSANKELRRQFKEKFPVLYIPEPNLSTDNAVMTAITGYFHQKETIPFEKLEAKPNLRI